MGKGDLNEERVGVWIISGEGYIPEEPGEPTSKSRSAQSQERDDVIASGKEM